MTETKKKVALVGEERLPKGSSEIEYHIWARDPDPVPCRLNGELDYLVVDQAGCVIDDNLEASIKLFASKIDFLVGLKKQGYTHIADIPEDKNAAEYQECVEEILSGEGDIDMEPIDAAIAHLTDLREEEKKEISIAFIHHDTFGVFDDEVPGRDSHHVSAQDADELEKNPDADDIAGDHAYSYSSWRGSERIAILGCYIKVLIELQNMGYTCVKDGGDIPAVGRDLSYVPTERIAAMLNRMRAEWNEMMCAVNRSVA
jgi:hypothetical protein